MLSRAGSGFESTIIRLIIWFEITKFKSTKIPNQFMLMMKSLNANQMQ